MSSEYFNRWFVADSGTGKCRPTTLAYNDHQLFETKEKCECSAKARLPEVSDGIPKVRGASGLSGLGTTDADMDASTFDDTAQLGFICTNRHLNQCMAITTPNSSYKVFPTYKSCIESPECHDESSGSFAAHEFPYQIPISSPTMVPVYGKYQEFPGLAGQGWSLLRND